MAMFTVGSLLGAINPRLGRCEIGICSRNTLRRLLCGLCCEKDGTGGWLASCLPRLLSSRSIVHSHHLDILGQWKGGPQGWNPAPNGYNMIHHFIQFLYNIHSRLYLIGALEPWNFIIVPSYWECHHPNCYSLHHFSEG